MLGCRRRLARRGLAPDGAALGAVFLREARAAVPAAWSEATVRAAVAVVNPTMTVGVVSAAAQQLAQEVFKIMLLQKLTLASAALLAAGLIAWGASAALVSLKDGPSQKSAAGPQIAVLPCKGRPRPPPRSPDRPCPRRPGRSSSAGGCSGRTGGPSPVRRSTARRRFPMQWQPYASQDSATTGPDGRFRFLADRRTALTVDNVKYSNDEAVVAATAPNYGLAWVQVPAGGRSDDLTLRLVDDRPITGQVVDLEGKPVPGANLQVLEVRAADGDDLGPWLEAARGSKGPSDELEWRYLPRVTIAPAPKATADAEGRIRLAGIGRDRLVAGATRGPDHRQPASQDPDASGRGLQRRRIRLPSEAITTYYGADFRHAAAPNKPIAGVVRDRDTKKPLAGITVTSERLANDPTFNQMVQTTTDAQGRYRLVGMPKGEGNRIKIVPGNDQPYLVSLQGRARQPRPGAGHGRYRAEARHLDRGQGDRQGDRQARGRPHATITSSPATRTSRPTAMTAEVHVDAGIDDDGSYRLAGMPGPGAIGVRLRGRLPQGQRTGRRVRGQGSLRRRQSPLPR